jgi:hypothetical protein
MKKVLALGMLAIGLIAFSQDQASAWKNHQFGIGLNWSRQSGGNNFGWGLYRNGQVPGPEAFGSGSYGAHSTFPTYGQLAPQNFSPFAFEDMPSVYDPSPYQFATYPRPEYYYYPTPYSYGR